jgi:hypothetical protein
MRVERLTALEMAKADWPMKEKASAAPAAHLTPGKKRLILLRFAPQEKTQPG